MPDQGTLTFVLGGARSGKSVHAEKLAAEHAPPWLYVATAQILDAEMEERVRLHRARRPAPWQTTEAPLDLAGALEAVEPGRPMLVDCLTLWLSNQMLAGADLASQCERLAAILARPRGPWFAVSNEVGLGIVPENALARRFRDEQGRLNQRVAAAADTVLLMVAGLPLKVK